MSGMSGRDYERILDLAVAALHERDPDRLWPGILAELPRVCGGELLIHKMGEWSDRSGALHLSAPDGTDGPDENRIDDQARTLLRRGYPLADHYLSTTDRTPLTADQVLDAGDWQRSETARLVRGIFSADHVLGLPLPDTEPPIRGCLIYRAGTDFPDTYLARARRLQPLLAGVDKQREVLHAWHAAAAARRDGPPDPAERALAYGLTPRETAVLTLLAEALTAASIGRRLGISARTVHKHIENLYRKLGTRDRVATVLRAQACDLLPARTEPIAPRAER